MVCDTSVLLNHAIRAGKTATLGFLVGQVMKASGGKANPKLVSDLVRRALAE